MKGKKPEKQQREMLRPQDDDEEEERCVRRAHISMGQIKFIATS